ncbi:phosphoribosyl-AMP cyclohydrolase [Microvirga sp. W0021]|uniref:Phosphoribosyl-AMP cyclohydrolase n=1 Tax=Hohaiivirga grylli TaxID=3133970 RepID=A0ABV0BLN5_9HYPH
MTAPNAFPVLSSKSELEEGTVFAPRFDTNGLITCVTIDAHTNQLLMVAYMNAEALRKTLDTGTVWYWSRSRQELWHKGATSGQIQTLVEMRTDCDQDALELRVTVGGDGGCCHTGRLSCFYRSVQLSDGTLKLVQNSK